MAVSRAASVGLAVEVRPASRYLLAMLPRSPLCLLLALACQPQPALPDLVLITWDTVRADRVGPDAVGAQGASPTPVFDRLAAEGVRFGEARTPAPLTLPAHASLLTGLAPPRPGARLNRSNRQSPDTPLLAEALQAQGYATGAFVSASVLRARYGLARGFQVYGDDLDGALLSSEAAYRSGERTLAQAEGWLRAQPRRSPVFLWLHLFDPHRPWQAPEPHASAHADPYLAEIAWTDALSGRLLELLDELGRLPLSVVVLTSDHGEGLGDHDENTHGWFVYESTVRVPLLFWSGAERGWKRGAVVEGPASLCDVAPTLAQLAGLNGFQADGESLLPSLQGAALAQRPLSLEAIMPSHHLGAAPVFGLLAGQELWVDLPRRERYDLDADPRQLNNLYVPQDATRAQELFAGVDRAWPPRDDALMLDEDTRTQLAALGYVVPDPEPIAEGGDLPDPKDLTTLFELNLDQMMALRQVPASQRAELHELLHGAGGALPAHLRLEAVRRARQDHPQVVALRDLQAKLLEELGRYQEALALLETSAMEGEDLTEQLETRRHWRRERQALLASIQDHLSRRPQDANARYDLALTLAQLERAAEAEAAFRAVLELRPEDDEARLQLGTLLWRSGRSLETLALLDVRRAAPGHGPQLDCLAGRVLAWGLQRPAEARAALLVCREGGVQLSLAEEGLL